MVCAADGSYLPGRFRNVNFYVQPEVQGLRFRNLDRINNVETSSMTIGRRGVLHQYPFKDTPYFEDMGRKAREFDMEIVFQGEDHVEQTELFIKAFEQRDPSKGTLVHPQRGTYVVYPIEADITDSEDSIGITKVNAKFVEAGEFRPASDGALTKVFVNINNITDRLNLQQLAVELEETDQYDFLGAPGTDARLEEVERLLSTIVDNISELPSTEIAQLYSNQPSFDIRTIYLTELMSRFNAGGLNRTELSNLRDQIQGELDNAINTGMSPNQLSDEQIQNAWVLRSQMHLNYNKAIQATPTTIRRVFGESLPSVITGQYGNTSHSNILAGNFYLTPLFMQQLISY